MPGTLGTTSVDDFRQSPYRVDTDTSLERSLMITTHIGSETTISWSVFTLLGHDSFAGRDTTIACCDEEVLVHL